jgi:hypothetical protein
VLAQTSISAPKIVFILIEAVKLRLPWPSFRRKPESKKQHLQYLLADRTGFSVFTGMTNVGRETMRRGILGSGPINGMQLCLAGRVRILANKRKNMLVAFSSIVWREAGPPGQTLRA